MGPSPVGKRMPAARVAAEAAAAVAAIAEAAAVSTEYCSSV